MAEKGRCGLLVLHSSPLIRKAILDLFRGDPGVTVLGGCPHPTAVGSLPGRRPDVALVEYEQWQGVRGNLAYWSGTRVILYSRDNTPAAWWIASGAGPPGSCTSRARPSPSSRGCTMC
ncbi:hypothetical protein Smic_69480 [Streptomyces microflavus]|uniref:Response regulatory domain-containing protein n=1 Tax=Streptomyces microflavus TaxID=1919 RepID=A0A7J0D104_STRMI|nr:hypothetical protein Smic_69480 [Streptomyces microflavus]